MAPKEKLMKSRKLLMIPGPIEFEPAVVRAMGAFTTSHVAPDFIETFGRALEQLREVFLCPLGQPFVAAGSGTLAMDMAASNLIEPGDRALVINTGYFGDRFADILTRYGALVDQVRAPVGDTVTPEAVENALADADYKLITITQVDTSTGVVADVQALAGVAHDRGVLVIVDGVCSVAGEELRQEDWGVDLALTASQKAISVPPGLAILVAGPRAMTAWRSRKSPVANYYADFANWLPIMEAYEARRPSYFGTPPVNLISALGVSLEQILAEGMEARFARHHLLSQACQAGLTALGLRQVPTDPAHAAATMSAPYYPEGVTGPELLPRIKAAGVILAGGLHPDIKAEYFRIGHMGPTHTGDLLATIGAVEAGLKACGHPFDLGTGVAATQAKLQAHP
jgi:alanine-glyoxylate transaminase/serine-glyoxylate transaminase/serine-pyruvate transaminase